MYKKSPRRGGEGKIIGVWGIQPFYFNMLLYRYSNNSITYVDKCQYCIVLQNLVCYCNPWGVNMGFDSKKIGERIYTARQNKGLKQFALGDMVGISQSTISEIESGTAKISVEALYKISEALDVSVLWLLSENSILDFTDSECLEIEKFKNYLLGIRKK